MTRRMLTPEEKREADEAALRALGAVAVGQVYECVPFLCRDGERVQLVPTSEIGKRIRIVQVPEGRKRTYRYVHVDPQPGGNGRPDRQSHPTSLRRLARNYVPVADDADDGCVECARCGRAVPVDDLDDNGRCDRCADAVRGPSC